MLRGLKGYLLFKLVTEICCVSNQEELFFGSYEINLSSNQCFSTFFEIATHEMGVFFVKFVIEICCDQKQEKFLYVFKQTSLLRSSQCFLTFYRKSRQFKLLFIVQFFYFQIEA